MDTKDINTTGERSNGDEAGSDSKDEVGASRPASYTAQLLYDQSRDRYRTLWCILIPMIVGIPIYFGAYSAVPAAVQQFLGPDSTILAAFTRFAGIGLVILLGTLIVVQLVSRMDRRPLIRSDWTNFPIWVRDFSIGFLIGAVTTVSSIGYLTVRGYLSLAVAPSGVGIDSVGMSLAVVLAFCFFILSNNIFEEVLFRGIVLEQTARGLRPHVKRIRTVIAGALIISTVIFGLFHLPENGIGGVVNSIIAGVLFGAAYLLTGRLAVAIGVHFGAFPLFSVLQAPLGDGLTLPAVVVAVERELSLLFSIEYWLVRVIVGIPLLVGLSYLMYGG